MLSGIKKLLFSLLHILPFTSTEEKLLIKGLEKRFLDFGVETTNVCNARCRFCIYRYNTVKSIYMSEEMFKEVLYQYNCSGGGNVNLTPTTGEPLLDPTLIAKCMYARSLPNIREIFFYTNLIGLESLNIAALLKSGISRISVSLSIGSRSMYVDLFGVDKYDQVMQNLINLLKFNEDVGRPVKIFLHVRTHDNFDYKSSHDYINLLQWLSEDEFIVKEEVGGYTDWGGKISTEDLPEGAAFLNYIPLQSDEPCAEMYRRVHVLADGRINFCVCADYERKMIVGDIANESISAIWQGNRMRQFRVNWRSGYMPAICRNCRSYTPLVKFIKKNRLRLWRHFLGGLWRIQ